MLSFHLHCIMRINKHFSESGRVALAVAYYYYYYKFMDYSAAIT